MPHKLTAMELDISGRVQGVGFRASMQAKAQALQLSGWVRNQGNGHVAALVQGPAADVDAIVAWCHQGPPAARVDAVLQRPCTVDPELSQFECLQTRW